EGAEVAGRGSGDDGLRVGARRDEALAEGAGGGGEVEAVLLRRSRFRDLATASSVSARTTSSGSPATVSASNPISRCSWLSSSSAREDATWSAGRMVATRLGSAGGPCRSAPPTLHLSRPRDVRRSGPCPRWHFRQRRPAHPRTPRWRPDDLALRAPAPRPFRALSSDNTR